MMPPHGGSSAMVDTRLGRFVLVATARGVSAVAPATGGRAEASRSIEGAAPGDGAAGAAVARAALWLAAYAEGDPGPFPGALDLAGTEFERQVWGRLLEIPFGDRETYGEIAARLGIPAGARRVGAAVAANPAAILVPCHRVVGARGTLTGYAWGLELKRRLIAHEAFHAPFTLSPPDGPRARERAARPNDYHRALRLARLQGEPAFG